MKQAVILAAGEGQRLRPFTATRPKSMLYIGDRPVLHYVIQALADNGIREIILVVGYKKEQIYDYFGAGEKYGIDISYVTQEKQLGTAHALLQVADRVSGDFLVFPADNYIDAGTIAGFMKMTPEAVLVKRVSEPERYGVIREIGGIIKSIQEKPEIPESNLVNTGIYLFSTKIFNFLVNELDITDALNAMISSGMTLQAIEIDGTWLDIVYPRDIIKLNAAVLHGTRTLIGGTIENGVVLKGKIVIGRNTTIRAGTTITGPVIISGGCEIGPQACILPATTIGENVTVAPFSVIENSVINADVCIGPGCIICHSVIGQGSTIKGKFTAIGRTSCVSENEDLSNGLSTGVIMGEDCEVDINVTVEPDIVIGNGCRIRNARYISSNIPDRSFVC